MKKFPYVFFLLFVILILLGGTYAYQPTSRDTFLLVSVQNVIAKVSDQKLDSVVSKLEKMLPELEENSRVHYVFSRVYELVKSESKLRNLPDLFIEDIVLVSHDEIYINVDIHYKNVGGDMDDTFGIACSEDEGGEYAILLAKTSDLSSGETEIAKNITSLQDSGLLDSLGEKKLICHIDMNDSIQEKNEDNNTYTFQFILSE